MGQAVYSWLLTACLTATIPSGARAIAEASFQDGCYTIEVLGSSRLTGAYLHVPDIPALFPEGDDGLVLSIIRLMLEGTLGSNVTYETNIYSELSRYPMARQNSTFAGPIDVHSPYRYDRLTWDYWSDGAVSGQLGIDRFFLNIIEDPIAISVGRLPINFSVMNMFSPNDFFAPFSPTAINTMYKPGVDAVRLAVTAGMLSSIEFIGVLGYGEAGKPSWGQTAVMARAGTVLWDFEWSVLGGKLAERWMAGAGLQGEINGFGIRAEGHLGFPDQDGRGGIDDVDGDGNDGDVYGRFAVGLDRVFNWQNAAIGAEYLYLSDGARNPENYDRRAAGLFPDDLFYLSRHYVGVSAGCDIIPILRVTGLGLANALDGSSLAGFTFIYNIADEADVVAGGVFSWGAEPSIRDLSLPTQLAGIGLESEFGLMPAIAYIETRFFF